MRELLIMADFSEPSLQRLRQAAAQAYHVQVLPPDGGPLLLDAALQSAEVIIGEPTEQQLRRATSLRWLQITWAGADRYLRGAYFPKNVLLSNASGAYGVTISEHVLGMLLSLCRHLPSYEAYQRRGVHKMAAPEKLLFGATALIYGTGDLGSNVARRLQAFDVHTIGICRRSSQTPAGFDEIHGVAEADTFLPKADFVICCLPGTEQTEGYFDQARFSQMPKGAVFLNVGRGSCVVTEALTQALQSGHLLGAGLDVTQPEPLPKDHPLRKLRNVILTPHIAGVGFGAAAETERRITAICCDNLQRYPGGWPLRNQVDFSSGYRKR